MLKISEGHQSLEAVSSVIWEPVKLSKMGFKSSLKMWLSLCEKTSIIQEILYLTKTHQNPCYFLIWTLVFTKALLCNSVYSKPESTGLQKWPFLFYNLCNYWKYESTSSFRQQKYVFMSVLFSCQQLKTLEKDMLKESQIIR